METHMDMSQEPFCVEIYRKNAWPVPGRQYGNLTRAHFVPFFGNLQEKCRTPIPRTAFCARACAVEAHMDISEKPFCVEFYRKNASHPFRGARFVRACAVETHMDTSHDPFYAAIHREKCRTPQWTLRLNTRPFTVTARTPSVWPHCLGNFCIISHTVYDHSNIVVLSNLRFKLETAILDSINMLQRIIREPPCLLCNRAQAGEDLVIGFSYICLSSHWLCKCNS